jgi:RHS repeat-associated protein
LRDEIRLHAEDLARKNGLEIEFIRKKDFRKEKRLSNGVSTDYDYRPETGRLSTLFTAKQSTVYQNLSYGYDGKGNITAITDSPTHFHTGTISQTFTYDALDRLATAAGTGTNWYNHNYQYDRIGNITYKSEAGASGSNTFTYTYDYPIRPHAVKTVTTDSPVYNDPLINIEYNYDQKPKLIKRNLVDYIRFTYDGSGQRVRKENLAIPQTTLYFGCLYEKRGSVEIVHVFAGNRRVASIRSDGNHQYYHPNHLGSASIVTGQDGDWRERIEYHPFGTYLLDDKNPSYPAFPDANYTFTDQEDDDDIGLYNYGARLYDPVIGRFISPDRIVQAPENPQSLNRYSYCLNNPLIYTDPSGEFWEWVIIGALFGAFTGAVEAHMNGQNWFVGALTGAVIGAVSGGVGSWVGGAVTNYLTTTAWIAESATATAAANIVGAMAGGFSGGAVAGGLNAAVYGGNVWQGALYGGLIGAAIAGTIAGAVQLNASASSSGIGGPAGSSGGVKPPGEVPPHITLPELKYDDLFFGAETKQTGGYYDQRESVTGESYPHGGVDRKPVWGAKSYGSVGSAPSDITLTYRGSLSGYGPVTEFNVQGYSSKLIIRIGHAEALDGLRVGNNIPKGSALFKLRYVPNVTTGPHAHIEVIFGGYKWDPGIVFK